MKVQLGERLLLFFERHSRLCDLVLLTPSLVLFIGFFIIPLTHVVIISFYKSSPMLVYIPGFTFDNYIRFLRDPYYINLLLVGIKMGIVVVVITFLLGYPYAYIIWRGSRKISTILLSFVLFSLFVNIVVRQYGWLIVLGRYGFLSYLLQLLHLVSRPTSFTYSFIAVVIGLTCECLPYVVLTLVPVLKNIDWNLVEAARNLGAGRLRSFYEVIFPLSMPGVVAAETLVFIWCVGAFVTPSMLGSAAETTIPCVIERQILRVFNWPFGAALSVILMLFFLPFLVLYNKLSTRRGGIR